MNSAALRWFVLYVFLLLIPCFGFWVAADSFLNAPAFISMAKLLPALWSEWIAKVEFHQSTMYVQMTVGELEGRLLAANQAGNAFAYKIDTRIVTYALPFYAALTFATPMAGRTERFLWGLGVYYPVVLLCLTSMAMQSMLTTLAPYQAQIDVSTLPQPHVVAVTYQLSVLILPVLVPVSVWLWQSRES
jgi:hypothetical protein